MRRHNILVLGTLPLLLAACSQAEVETPKVAEEATAQFVVNLPKDFSSRAFGDGLTATDLSVLVYEVGDTDNTFLISGDTSFEANSYTTTVNLNLVTGKSYLIVFFAQSENSSDVYTINKESGVLTVNYSNMTSANNLADAYDCFYGTYATGMVGDTSLSTTVNLNRPVAQINWGTTEMLEGAITNFDDIFGQNGDYILTTFTTTAYTTLNLQNGEYGNMVPVKLSNFAAPSSEDGTFPISGYEYLAVQYLLAKAGSSETYELNLTVTNNGGGNTSGTFTKPIPISNAPLQANYQTNIYGAVLTANASLTVSKQEGKWSGSYVENLVWNGTTVTYPTVDEQSGTVSVNQPSDLAGLADMVNGTGEYENNPNDFDGFTITLADDFDMGGNTFPGIGSATRDHGSLSSSSNSFKGVFDGQGHTISNLVIEGTTNADDAVGLFPAIDGADAVVKNLVVTDITINAPNNEQAAVVGVVTNGATVSNITVTSGSISAKEGAAGIVGRVIANGTVTGCSNAATITSAGTNAGGIVGAAYYTTQGTTMTISNCSNNGNVSGQSQAIGGIVGLSAANITGCTNKGIITGADTATGGIVGQQNCAGSIVNCTNNGQVKGGSGYGSGGIVGWVRYNGTTTDYARQNIISVTGCTNTASITGSTGVGGIVGMWYMSGVCQHNVNTATSLSASGQFVAGIIGGQQWTTEGPNTTTGDLNHLIVTNNISTTPVSDITGQASAQYIYVNSPDNVTMSDNTDVLP